MEQNIKYLQSDGNKIYYNDSGSGKTTVILVSGLTLGLETWKSFQEQLFLHARIISYDRSGLGNSDYIPNHKTIESMTKELDILINGLEIDTPIILVGHSVGGYIIRKYAQVYPEKIVGLFLIDSYHENFFIELKDSVTEKMWNDYIADWEALKNEVSPGISDEISIFLGLMLSNEKYPIPYDIPVSLFTSIRVVEIAEKFIEFNNRAIKVHARLNSDIESKYENVNHFITDKSSHFIYLEEPELIIKEILKIV